MRAALVCGAGGFIGGHLVRSLKAEGFWVRGVDLKRHEYAEAESDDFVIGDLREPYFCRQVIDQRFDEVYQLAADMGGAGFIFTGENDADIMHNSATININVIDACCRRRVERIFYSSSACMYPAYNQQDPASPNCSEASAYPAAPDSEYGWEKLFSERLYMAYARCRGIQVRIARYHNIFGPEGAWTGGREKAPAALCRKIAVAEDGDSHRDLGRRMPDPVIPLRFRMHRGNLAPYAVGFHGPVNIGSEEMVTIDAARRYDYEDRREAARKTPCPGPLGVRARNSDNRLIRQKLGWEPSLPLETGLGLTYSWIERQTRSNARQGVLSNLSATSADQSTLTLLKAATILNPLNLNPEVDLGLS